MSRVPWYFWVAVGVLSLFAYSVAHRKAQLAAQVAAAQQEDRQASTPLQPFTQPQPAPSAYWAYGQVPFGTDAVTSTARFQYQYSSSAGALA